MWEGRAPRWALLVEGLVSLGAGLLALLLPALWSVALPRLVGGWAVASGALKALQAARLRHDPRHAWLLSLAGLSGIPVGVILLLEPFAWPTSLALVGLIGVYALGVGAILLALCDRLYERWSPERPRP